MTKLNKDDRWLWEFSKKIVWVVTIIFVAAFLLCGILVFFYPDSTAIQWILENISDVFKVTVVSYAVKAGFENVTKIRRNKDVGLFNTSRRRTDSSDAGNSRCD